MRCGGQLLSSLHAHRRCRPSPFRMKLKVVVQVRRPQEAHAEQILQ